MQYNMFSEIQSVLKKNHFLLRFRIFAPQLHLSLFNKTEQVSPQNDTAKRPGRGGRNTPSAPAAHPLSCSPPALSTRKNIRGHVLAGPQKVHGRQHRDQRVPPGAHSITLSRTNSCRNASYACTFGTSAPTTCPHTVFSSRSASASALDRPTSATAAER